MALRKKILPLGSIVALGCIAAYVIRGKTPDPNNASIETITVIQSRKRKESDSTARPNSDPARIPTSETENKPPPDLAPSLNDEEVQIISSQIHEFVTNFSNSLDPEAQKAALEAINSYGEKSRDAAVRYLKNIPADTKELRKRLSVAEYLSYRARWDQDAKRKVLSLVGQPISKSLDANLQAMIIAENC